MKSSIFKNKGFAIFFSLFLIFALSASIFSAVCFSKEQNASLNMQDEIPSEQTEDNIITDEQQSGVEEVTDGVTPKGMRTFLVWTRTDKETAQFYITCNDAFTMVEAASTSGDVGSANFRLYGPPGYTFYSASFNRTAGNRPSRNFSHSIELVSYSTNYVTLKASLDWSDWPSPGDFQIYYNVNCSQKSFNDANLSVNPSSYTYTGSAIIPTTRVTFATSGCIGGTVDTKYYSKSGSNNINVGTSAKVTVTPRSPFSGRSKSATFSITKLDWNTCTATLSKTIFEYTGSDLTNTIKNYVTVKDSKGNTITAWSIKGSSVTNVGTSGYVEIKGSSSTNISNYSTAKKLSVKIMPGKPSGFSRQYDGSTHYSFEYSDGYHPTRFSYSGTRSATRVGSYTCTYTPKSGYTWSDGSTSSYTVNYSITKASNYVSVTAYDVYYGDSLNIRCEADFGSPRLTYRVYGSGSSYSSTRPTAVGRYQVKAEVADSTNYGGGYDTDWFYINQATNSWITTPSIASWVYGSPNSPSGSAKFGTITYKYKVSGASDSTYTTTKPTSVGNYVMQASVSGTTNYTGISKTVNFSITKQTISSASVSLSANSYIYNKNGQAPTPTVVVNGRTLTKGTDYTISYNTSKSTTGATSTVPSNTGTYYLIITGKGNYTGTCYSSSYSIQAKPITATDASHTISKTQFDYTGSAITLPTITVSITNYGKLVEGVDYDIKYFNESGTEVTGASIVAPGTYTVKIIGKGNYSGTRTDAIVINASSLGDATINLSSNKFTYNATSQVPSITVVDSLGQTLSSSDYVVTYYKNGSSTAISASGVVDAGTYIARISPAAGSKYTGSKDATFVINPASITNLSVSFTEIVYNGTSQIPSVTRVVAGSLTLIASDYNVSTSGNFTNVQYSGGSVIAGGTISVTGTGNFTGTKSASIKIMPFDLKGATLTLSPTTFVFDNTAKQPTVTAKMGSTTISSADYTVSYSGNVNKGTAKATITAKSGTNFTGTAEKTYQITARNLSNTTISSIADIDYTGSAIKPSFTVSDTLTGLTRLSEGAHYTISGYEISNDNGVTWNSAQPIGPGFYRMTLSGANNYQGTKTQTFTIVQKDVAYANISVSGGPYTYSGLAFTPSVTVVLDGETLTNGTHYDVSYSQKADGSNATSSAINAGTYYVVITGKSPYTGTGVSTTKFTINQKSIAGGSLSLGSSSFVYDGKVHKPTATISLSGFTDSQVTRTLVYKQGSTAGATVTNPTNVMTYYAVVTGTGNFKDSLNAPFTITPLSITGKTVNIEFSEGDSYIYTGSQITPAINKITITNGSDVLTIPTYLASFGENINVSTGGSVTITASGNFTGTASKNFAITKKAISKPTAGSNLTFSNTEQTYVASGFDAKVMNVTGNRQTNAGTYKAVYTLKDPANYMWLDGTSGNVEISWRIVAKNLVTSNVTCQVTSTHIYNRSSHTPTFTLHYGSVLLDTNDFTATFSNNTNAGRGVISVTFKGNYSGSAKYNFTISPKPIDDASISVSVTDSVYTSYDIKKVPTVKDGTLQLVNNTHFVVTYSTSDFKKVQTITVTIKGKGNYTGSRITTYNITQKDISSLSPEIIADIEFNNNANHIVPTLKFGQDVLNTLNEYGTVSYAKREGATFGAFSIQAPVDVGTYKIKVTGKGNYTGENSLATFNITRKSVADFVIEDIANQPYTGTRITPSVVVKWKTTDASSLIVGTDYTISYGTNLNVGEGSVTITGINNYTGSLSKTFVIVAKELYGNVQPSVQGPIYYTGSAITLTSGLVFSVEDTARSQNLVLGTDYEITGYTNNINKSETAQSTFVTIKGKGNYTGNFNVYFTILPRSIEGGTVANFKDSTPYTGSSITQDGLTLTLNGRLLKFGTDYKLDYESNKDAGTAKVFITGINNYDKTITKTWTITKVTLTDSMVTLSPNFLTYNGKAQLPEIIVNAGYTNLTLGTDYTQNVTRTDGKELKDVGTLTLTITGVNNFLGEVVKTFDITPKSIANVEFPNNNIEKEYQGLPIELTNDDVTVLDAEIDQTLTMGTDYQIVGYAPNNIDAGLVVVTIKGLGNYSSSTTAVFEFTIKKAILSSVELSQESVIFDRNSHQPTIKIVKAEDAFMLNSDEYTIKYYRNYVDETNKGTETTDFTSAGVVAVEVTALPGSKKYGGTKVALFTIKKAVLSLAEYTPQVVTFDKKAHMPVVQSVKTANLTLNSDEYAITYYRNYVDETNKGTETTDFTNAGTITTFVEAISANFEGSLIVTTIIQSKNILDTDVAIKFYFVDNDGNFVDEERKPSATKVYMKGDQTYEGQLVEAELVYFDSQAVVIETLVKEKDYDYVYIKSSGKEENFTEVGEVTLTITAKGNYQGVFTDLYKINPQSLLKGIEIEIRDKVYTGDEITLSNEDIISCIDKNNNNKNLVLGKDYEVVQINKKYQTSIAGETIEGERGYLNNINVGVATVYFGAINENYFGILTVHFNIVPLDISTQNLFEFEVDSTSKIYNRAEQRPKLSVSNYRKDAKTVSLFEGKDYTLSYQNNIDAGLAQTIVTGRGNFTGSISLDFTISPKNLSESDVVVSGIIDVIKCDEQEHKQNPILTYVGVDLLQNSEVKDFDYDLKYFYKQTESDEFAPKDTDFSKVGYYKIEVWGTNNFTGTKIIEFTIIDKMLSKIEFTLNDILTSRTEYNREVQMPNVSIYDENNDVVLNNSGNEHFDVTYYYGYDAQTKTWANNSAVQVDAGWTNVDLVKVEIVGKNGFAGRIVGTFEIYAKEITDSMISGILTTYTFRNEQILPTNVEVKFNLIDLVKDSEFKITYGENINVSTGGSVVISGVGNYSGVVTKTFKISALDISLSEDVTFNTILDKTYNGNVQELTNDDLLNLVTFKTNPLVAQTDFVVTYNKDENRKDANTYSVYITGTNNYQGTKTLSYTINPKVITESDIIIESVEDQTYTRNAITPVPLVKDSTTGDIIDVVFDYLNNTNVFWSDGQVAQNAKIIVKQVNNSNYILNSNEEKFIYFKILPKNLTDSDIVLSGVLPFYRYTGSAIEKPTPVLTWGESNLKNLTDYEVKYYRDYESGVETEDFTNLGIISVVITAKADGNYINTISVDYNIIAADLSEVQIDFDKVYNFVYNGSAFTPTLEILLDTFVLEDGRDYALTYKNNTNAGTATITITGIGSFNGTREKEFEISPKSITNLDITQTEENYEFLGTEIKPEITILDSEIIVDTASKILASGFDYDITYYRNYVDENSKGTETTDFVNVGTITFEIVFKNNYIGFLNTSYTITAKELTDEMLNQIETQIFTGRDIKPDVYVTYNGIKFDVNLQNKLTATYQNNKDVTFDENNQVVTGASVTISANSESNFSGSATVWFKIDRLAVGELSGFDYSINNYPQDGFTYKAKEFTPSITLTPKELQTLQQNVDYKLRYFNNLNVSTEDERAIIYVDFVKNYKGTCIIYFDINKESINALTFDPFAKVTYDGNSHLLEPVIRFNGNIVSSEDYTLVFYRNYGTQDSEITTDFVNSGTITIKVLGGRNFDGQRDDLSYTILQRSLSEVTLSIKQDFNLVYTGSKITPEVDVTFAGMTLILWQDFEISYGSDEKDNTNVKSGGVLKISSNSGNYCESQTLEFEIEAKEITIDMVAEIGTLPYNGEEIKPDVLITYGENVLVVKKDFTTIYQNNINFGTASITITGIDNYVGTVITYFEISGLVIQDDTIRIVWNIENLIYTGQEITPNFELYYNNKTESTSDDTLLVLLADYTFKFENNTNKTTDARLVVTGVRNYAGTITKTFEIKAKQLEFEMFQGIKDVEFARQEIKPLVLGEYNNKILEEDIDYTIVYEDNFNVGPATILLTGKGNFAGTIQLGFKIYAKGIDNVVLSSTKDDYNGLNHQVTFEVFAGHLKLDESDYFVKYYRGTVQDVNEIGIDDFTNAGDILIVVQAKGNFTNKIIKNYKIAQKNIADQDVDINGIEDKLYSGTEILQDEIQIVFNTMVLAEFDDYKLIYSNNLNAGTAVIKIIGQNNYFGTVIENFEIGKIDPNVNPFVEDKTYYAGDKIPTLKLGLNDTKGVVSIQSKEVLIQGANTCVWLFVPEDSVNYNIKLGNITIFAQEVVVERVELVGNYNTNYTAYDKFKTEGITIKAIYNNKMQEIIDSSIYVFKIGEQIITDGHILQVNDQIEVFVLEKWVGGMKIPITIKPIVLDITFGNTNFIENETLQQISFEIEGDLDGYSPNVGIKYFKDENQRLGLFESGEYLVQAYISNPNYTFRDGENELKVMVKKGVIYSEDKMVVVISPNGFDDDVWVEITEITDEEKKKEILGSFKYNSEKIYSITMYKGDQVYEPEFEITLRILVTDARLFNNENFQLFTKVSDTYFKRVVFDRMDEDYVEIKDAMLGTYIFATSGENFMISWWVWLILVAIISFIVILIFVMRIQSKKRRKKLNYGINNITKND